MTITHASPLVSRLTALILEKISGGEVPVGSRLVERKLAEQLRVSRSPIRQALRFLGAQGLVGAAEAGGFIVIEPNNDTKLLKAPVAQDDELYHRIAADRLDTILPDRITESALMRRYKVTHAQLSKVLRRILSESWIERLPGHGWEFLPMLNSMEAYEDSYRFRLLIEPAAILEPRFSINRTALERCRSQQQELIDGGIWTVSNAVLFDANCSLHESIIECSQNVFFIDGLRRINNRRRLIEYKQSLDRKYAIIRCQEHVELIDLVLAGRREDASEFMRSHLASVGMQKTACKGRIAPPKAA